MLATILDPDPIPRALQELAETLETFAGGGDDKGRFSFGPCFITSTRTGHNTAYSYLDLHGHFGGTGAGTGALDDGIQGGEEENADVDVNYD
jgi:hypothetical protein